MVRSKMQKCKDCGAYGLSTTCKKCGGTAQAAGPLKFSPQDPQAKRRREYQKVTDPKWVENLPSPKVEEE
ncbi:MAG: ribosome biogenesis protein [Euryarchaeota archaeon]|jgi:rRNA maturation protein Nop10|nr:ribosome biogenesis protein [Euryarchaeota archaeon]